MPPVAVSVQPAYAAPCVPPGHEVVVSASAPPPPPPDAVTVSNAVDVTLPAEFVAVSVYVVVAAGLTFVEPLADVDVNVPGVMAMLAAPVTTQLSELLEPAAMLVGLAVNEVMAGLLGGGALAVTVTVTVDVVDPDELLAVSV